MHTANLACMFQASNRPQESHRAQAQLAPGSWLVSDILNGLESIQDETELQIRDTVHALQP